MGVEVILVKAGMFLLSISILVILHEFGHFLPAKLFGTKVEKFYLFFDYKFSLFKKKIGETVYGIGWIPLGGYVKIAGMIDESMDTEQMAGEPQPWEFRTKPAWQRLIIMLGGVTVNFLLAVFIYIGMAWFYGDSFVEPKEGLKYGMGIADSFKEYGFQDGDVITKVNGEDFEDFSSINRHLLFRDVESIEVVHSDGNLELINLPEDIGKRMFASGDMKAFFAKRKPIIDSIASESVGERIGVQKGDQIIGINGKTVKWMYDFTSNVDREKENEMLVLRKTDSIRINFSLSEKDKTYGFYGDKVVTISTKEFSFLEAIPFGINATYWQIREYLAQFKYIFTKKGAQSLGGFLAIAKIFPDQWNWHAFWAITAFLSIMLGVINLLPIPALDGGHVVFTLYEMISGRKPGDKFLETAQIIGFFIIMGLVLFANGNDIYKLITG